MDSCIKATLFRQITNSLHVRYRLRSLALVPFNSNEMI
jgi:hypothetical protein